MYILTDILTHCIEHDKSKKAVTGEVITQVVPEVLLSWAIQGDGD